MIEFYLNYKEEVIMNNLINFFNSATPLSMLISFSTYIFSLYYLMRIFFKYHFTKVSLTYFILIFTAIYVGNLLILNNIIIASLLILVYIFLKCSKTELIIFKSVFLTIYFTLVIKASEISVALYLVLSKNPATLELDIYKNILVILLLFVFTPKVSILFNELLFNVNSYKNYAKWIIGILITMLVGYNFFSIYSLLHKDKTIYFLAISIVFIFITIALYIAIMLLKNIKLEIKNKEELKRIAQQKKYIEDLEKNNSEIRKFKHDFNNIILGLSGYINEDVINQEKLKDYFNNHIIPSNTKLKENTKMLFNLNNIKIASLKTILLNKLAIAQSKNIDVQISVENEIDSLFTNEMEFNRVVGILIDNAVEACENLDNKNLSVTILRIDKTIDLTISNTFENNGISIKDFKTEGFSTKGENRGLGLSSAQEIVDKYNMILNTEIKDNIFKQNLIIEGDLYENNNMRR